MQKSSFNLEVFFSHRILVAQIILGSDYSGSAKAIRQLLQPVLKSQSKKIWCHNVVTAIEGLQSKRTLGGIPYNKTVKYEYKTGMVNSRTHATTAYTDTMGMARNE